MKKYFILFSLVLSVSFLTSSCKKDDKNDTSTIQIAESRLAAANFWYISDASVDGKILVKDRVSVDPDSEGMAEWLKFDNIDKTVEVKYPDEVETTIFNYSIVGDKFSILDGSSEQEVMTIKAGSVFETYFSLIQMDGGSTFDIRLERD